MKKIPIKFFLILASISLFVTHSPVAEVVAVEKDPLKPEPSWALPWKHSGSIWILTDPQGADLPAQATIKGFPLLVRLHRDFFDFHQAQPDGRDLRFSTPQGDLLPYQIESWNEQGTASIWVRVPIIRGNTRQELKLWWGNPDAASESDGQRVFQTSDGFATVIHMVDPLVDVTGSMHYRDAGTTPSEGMIGTARHFDFGTGIFGGEALTNFSKGAQAHTTEVWFRTERPNSTIVAWGIEQAQGKVVMQFRSPPHLRTDCYFSAGNVDGTRSIPHDWTHVAHTYHEGEAKLYVNGTLDSINQRRRPPMNLPTPVKLWLGGWYDHFDFTGDMDEVRISQVARSADWIKLEYENQKRHQTLVGPVVPDRDLAPINEFSVTPTELVLKEGTSAPFTLQARGAQKVVWILNDEGDESVVATDRSSFTFYAGRIPRTRDLSLTVKGVFDTEVKSVVIPIQIQEAIPDPEFQLVAPSTWDGRNEIELFPQLTNSSATNDVHDEKLHFRWTVDGVAVNKRIAGDKLILKRALGSGPMRVSLGIDNGGAPTVHSVTIQVQEPSPSSEEWMARPITPDEHPTDNQFIPREGTGRDGTREGTLVYAGTMTSSADEIFVRVFADDQLFAEKSLPSPKNHKYTLIIKLKADLVKYRTEFGTRTRGLETVLHRAENLLCGDVFLINGQSNAVATDFGEVNDPPPNPWVRTFSASTADRQGGDASSWTMAQARTPDGESAIGYWGLELGNRLVRQHQLPICILNGAVGGSRIDQHQRNPSHPTDVETIYGRLLWRVQQAKLTQGVRAVIWHQGENDQGADGPTGGYGYQTYRDYFIDLAASWKEDFPNIQRFYVFQIWPKACSMGMNGSDNRLREVQRTLPHYFSNLSVLSTVGIKPPGGCHFPAAGYAEFAKMLSPRFDRELYHLHANDSVTPPNIQRARFTSDACDELELEFDQSLHTQGDVRKQLHLSSDLDHRGPDPISSIRIIDRTLVVTLTGPSKAKTITYVDGDHWSPDDLIFGDNGLAALTFCDVPIEPYNYEATK